MPPFGSRKRANEITREPELEPAPEPAVTALSATERLGALISEQSQIHETLDRHREERAELLKEDGQLGAIRALQTESDGLRLRLEQIDAQLPGIERELAHERALAFEASWQAHRPGLRQAETELVDAIEIFLAALERANTLHGRITNFGRERTQEFATPPPLPPIFNHWSLVQYLRVVRERSQPVAAAILPDDLVIETPLDLPPAERFVPQRVPWQLVEQISPIAPTRKVRLLHTVRASDLGIGHARLKAGDEMMFPARAAFALVHSGVGIYTDGETAETAA